MIRAPFPPWEQCWSRGSWAGRGQRSRAMGFVEAEPPYVGLAPWPWLGTGIPSALQQKIKTTESPHRAPSPWALRPRCWRAASGAGATRTPLPAPSHPAPSSGGSWVLSAGLSCARWSSRCDSAGFGRNREGGFVLLKPQIRPRDVCCKSPCRGSRLVLPAPSACQTRWPWQCHAERHACRVSRDQGQPFPSASPLVMLPSDKPRLPFREQLR